MGLSLSLCIVHTIWSTTLFLSLFLASPLPLSDVVWRRLDAPVRLNLLRRLRRLPPPPRPRHVVVLRGEFDDVDVHGLEAVEARRDRAQPEGDAVALAWDELALDVGDVHEQLGVRGALNGGKGDGGWVHALHALQPQLCSVPLPRLE